MAQAANDEQPITPAGYASPVVADASRRGLLPLMWPLFAVAWLIFLIPLIVSVLQEDFTPVRLLAVLTWAAVFVAVYLCLMLHYPFRVAEPAPPERQFQIGLLVALAALALYFDLAYGPDYSWLFIYVTLAAGVTLPTRSAVWTIAATAVVVGGIHALRSQWTDVWTEAPGIAVMGSSMILVRRLVVTVRELQAARGQIALLAVAEAVAEERLRFARDLHDLLGHSLSLITLKSELAGRLVQTDRERAAAEIADVERVARQALGEVREAVAGYRRPTLSGELDGVREMLAAAGIETRIESTAGPLPLALDTTLAWMVREGATNVIRHSRARHCEIRVRREDGTVSADVLDDGRGAPAWPPGQMAGSGLSGLAERVAKQDGRFATGARGGGGFRLHVTLPFPDGTRDVIVPDGARADGA
jgi:two-component system sensor histidine kinase DesK